MLSTVTNNGGPIKVKIGKKSHVIPQGRSDQSTEVLGHPLCVALMTEKSPIMQPQGDSKNGQWLQLRGLRLVIDTPVATIPAATPVVEIDERPMTVAVLKPIIEACTDLEMLAEFAEDGRATVKAAVAKRFAELEAVQGGDT